ncbi:hypothetical protein [Bradyrhizobium icense]|uniref:Uncharacterized protein n=1 Tax=Bradyrhizobium icense TaxID=1274631 RepID=A0A1B1UBF5_9BRAD|nr:hypothetical protein [Bradyrhizobium icense]ANW00107.1 hypothetical protein LMTR13_07820 [Bradyrhizobium icense]
MPRYFAVEVERTVIQRRVVYVEVAETDERLKDAHNPDWKDCFRWDAEDAAVKRARTESLAGWEQVSVEYSAHKSQPSPTKQHNVDISV